MRKHRETFQGEQDNWMQKVRSGSGLGTLGETAKRPVTVVEGARVRKVGDEIREVNGT